MKIPAKFGLAFMLACLAIEGVVTTPVGVVVFITGMLMFLIGDDIEEIAVLAGKGKAGDERRRYEP